MQEHISSQHISEVFSCPLCSLVSNSQLELQEHLFACHMEVQQEQENGEEGQASTSYTVRTAASRNFN